MDSYIAELNDFSKAIEQDKEVSVPGIEWIEISAKKSLIEGRLVKVED